MLSVVLMTLLAQAPAKPEAVKQEPAKAEAPKPEVAKPEGEKPFTISTEVGHRWLTNQNGSFNTYRSVVNLGEGPRVLGFEAGANGTKAFDLLRLTGANWG